MSEFITQRMREHQRTQATHVAEERSPVAGLEEVNYALTRRGMADVAKGAVSGFIGLPGDILANYTSPGAEAELGGDPALQNYVRARQADYTSNVDPKDQPFTTEWFGERFGADIDRAAFQTGTFIDPTGPIKKGFLVGAGYLMGQRGARNILGKRGKAIQGAFTKAQDLAYEGVSPLRIWQETNWIIDPADGLWKYQLPHWEAKIDYEFLRTAFDFSYAESGHVKLSDFYKLPGLYEAYPELANTKVSWDMFSVDNVLGRANPIKNTIEIFETNAEDFIDTLSHEIEHLVQYHENFQGGGSVDLKNLPTLEKLKTSIQELGDSLSHNRYQRDLYKFAMGLTKESFDDEIALGEAFTKHLANLRGIDIKDVVLSYDEAAIIRSITEDYRNLHRTGRWLSTEKNVINLGIQASLLEQRNAFLNGIIEAADAGGITENKEELYKLTKAYFMGEYRALAGETNARLATIQTRLGRTEAGLRALQYNTPIEIRDKMQISQGKDPTNISLVTPAEENIERYTQWYRYNLETKAEYQALQEAIQEYLNANTKP